MDVPALYAASLTSLQHNEVSFGSGGIHLFRSAEIEDGQVGYSISRDGSSLCDRDEDDGLWRPNWIVIGYDTGCGDPLLIDSNDAALPVLRAINGQRTWEPLTVAASVGAFLTSLEAFRLISTGRVNPVELETNPVTENERKAFLDYIRATNEGGVGLDFWVGLLEG